MTRTRSIFLPFTLFIALFMATTNTNAQENPYDQLWEKVEELKSKGLPGSAQEIVTQIYQLAKEEENQPQVIRTLLYRAVFLDDIEENHLISTIDSIEDETDQMPEPAKSILESISAQMYHGYFRQHRNQIYGRTPVLSAGENDITSWTAADFQEKISHLLLSSLQPSALLKTTALDDFKAVIDEGNARNLRPTLFDLLAQRALDYFVQDERDITRPAYAFEIADASAFAPAAAFSEIEFSTKDTASLQFKALQLFQELITMHLKNTRALINVDLQRLAFVHHRAVMPGKDALYMEALKKLYQEYPHEPAVSEAGFQWAAAIYNKAIQMEQSALPSETYTVKRAHQMLNEIIQKYPESRGAIEAKNMVARIESPALALKVEKVNVPGIPFRSFVSFKNIDEISLRLVALNDIIDKSLERIRSNDQKIKRILNLPAIKQWQQNVPDNVDFLTHSAEIKIDALPTGKYLLIASRNNDFQTDKSPIAICEFHVSNISFINNGREYFVLSRHTGQPLEGAHVQVWRASYNYRDGGRILKKIEDLKTGKNGYLQLTRDTTNENTGYILLEISYRGDHLFLDDQQYEYFGYYNSNPEEKEAPINQETFDKKNAMVYLFTDRSIYRPGQTIYFKGIGVTKNVITGKNQLLRTKDAITVFLFDANNQKVDSMEVLLNEYGSISGQFRLPEGRMNGIFRLEIIPYKESNTRVSVEEYKRPNFFVNFKTPDDTYRVNESITVTGLAQAFAGYTLSGAQVTYRVIRKARFIFPWMFWRRGYPTVAPLEITHGTAQTNDKGQFTVSFPAIPDRDLDSSMAPVFDYEITADITDISGETHSGTITVSAGYQSIILNLITPNSGLVHKDSLKDIKISAKNLSGVPQKVVATVQIYRLQPPSRLLRQRLWEQPDTFVMSKKEYIKYFPHDEYDRESSMETWKKTKKMCSLTDTVGGSTSIALPDGGLPEGSYVIEISATDKYGATVQNKQFIRVFQPGQKLPAPEYLLATRQTQPLQPGDTARITFASTADNVFLISKLDSMSENEVPQESDYRFYQLNNAPRNIKLPINETDRGGFGYFAFFVKHNRFYFSSNIIKVPWKNKELDITFDTYRNKTLPGSKEQWEVTIKGHKGEKIAAELLASMYDRSLDQFKPHLWQIPQIWPVYHGYRIWRGNQNFTAVPSFGNYWSIPHKELPDIVYDALLYLPAFNQYYRTFNVALRRTYDSAQPEGELMESRLQPMAPLPVGMAPKMEEKEITTPVQEDQNPEIPGGVQVRRDFRETAFFYPHLRTDEEGSISFGFTMPEALTEWKLMTLAHTRDLAMGYAQETVKTQKQLMVQPNVPRFFREGDTLVFSAKIVNLAQENLNGTVSLHLLNAATMQPVDDWFALQNTEKQFQVNADSSIPISFHINIPRGFNDMVLYRIVAQTSTHSDGQEDAIPVVTNRMLVTETLPMPMNGAGTEHFKFKKLSKSAESQTLTNYGLTIEYTPNPAWYAVQALPYLADYPYECAEQNFNRYFANALAMHIVHGAPRIAKIFQQWKTTDSTALMSSLEKNEALKSVILDEAPWVLAAKNESQRKKNIALMFDIAHMSANLNNAISKLQSIQLPNGAFPWFKGGHPDRYITQYIAAGIGHLQHLNAWPERNAHELKKIIFASFDYLDKSIVVDYEQLKIHSTHLDNHHLSPLQIQYLYLRSLFPERETDSSTKEAVQYYFEQAKKYWLRQNKYMQGMIAHIMHRSGHDDVAHAIVLSLKETAIHNDELGMYWKELATPSYHWSQSSIEAQSLMIGVFSEITQDQKSVRELKTWLLKNKQTNNWGTTKASADACYALLLQGTDWLQHTPHVVINLGEESFDNNKETQEAGSGYFKRRIDGNKVAPSMGNIDVTVLPTKGMQQTVPSWGAVYWQYFEDLDKITFAETPLKISRDIFLQENTDSGPVLIPLSENNQLNVGDKIKIRIEISVDRDMEYVHMKDRRAACMEPVHAISAFKWQGGLGYYESTKDVSTHFFFSRLPKGHYVFEYPMFITHKGSFSTGVATIQCMYAPEFTAHSNGGRVVVE